MLKSNSKIVREKVRDYIRQNYDGTNYELSETTDFSVICKNILDVFHDEKVRFDKRRMTRFELFHEWNAGLPTIFCTDSVFYRGSAVELVDGWLEETETEKARFDERKAELMFSRLCFAELEKGAAKFKKEA